MFVNPGKPPIVVESAFWLKLLRMLISPSFKRMSAVFLVCPITGWEMPPILTY